MCCDGSGSFFTGRPHTHTHMVKMVGGIEFEKCAVNTELKKQIVKMFSEKKSQLHEQNSAHIYV